MFKKLFSTNKASIGRKSKNNIIVQDSVINAPVVCSNGSDMIRILGECGKYDLVQQQMMEMMSAASKTHPLYPVFSARPSNDLHRLVSTPETKDAFKQYPKIIKGTFLIDYKKYPHMDKSETPWEYAYRTQTTVELKTTEYQEYLGDIKDPFPVTEYSDGMITVIGAPEFPDAVSATISSGDISIPIMLRRKPCMEYGKMVFGTVTSDSGFTLKITTCQGTNKTDFTFTKASECDLITHLQRERLILEMSKTKKMNISIDSTPLLDTSFNPNELMNDMFKSAPYMVSYLENLQIIEKHLGFKFDITNAMIPFEDYRTAFILASSLEEKWHRIEIDFDDETRCDYNNIPDDFANISSTATEAVVEGKVFNISLQGQHFSADKYIVLYKGVRVNNTNSVQKNIKKRKKDIMITFKPVEGKKSFYKYYYLEGIKLL